jgi:hypothetical protein
MPLPAIVGAGALAGAIGSFFTTVTTILVTIQIKKILIVVAGITAVYLATVQLFEVAEGVMSNLLANIPSGLNGLGYLFPSNTAECISAIIAVQTACFIYTLTFKAVKLQMNLS